MSTEREIELKNNVWSYLLLQSHHVCDAIMRELSIATGNCIEPAKPGQLNWGTANRANTATALSNMTTHNSQLVVLKTGTESAVKPTTETKVPRKRISDISQLRLDAYVARSAEQAEKGTRANT